MTRGRWAFDGRYTQNPLLPAAQRGGAAFADFLLGPLQSLRRAGRRADRQLPLELLRALRPGQLAGRLERHGQLRPALGVRPAVPRRERRDRQHRLRLGQHAGAGVRADRHRRSVRGRPGVPARARRAVRARRPLRPRRLSQRLQRLRAAARHRLDRHAEDRACAAGGGIYYVRDIGNAVFDTVRNAPFTIRRDEPAETFRPNLSFQQPFVAHGRADVHPRHAVGRADRPTSASGRSACSAS